MAKWIPIENSLSLEGLLKRWKGIEIDGAQIDFNIIDQLVRALQLTAYDKKDWIVSGGHKEWRGEKRNPVLGLNGCEPQGQCDVIFDMKEVCEIEKEFTTPQSVNFQKDSTENDSKPKMYGDKYVFAEHQLIKKKDLYQRWFGATCEEIATHVENGELSAYEHYKGPINGIIWCKSGTVSYRDQIDYSNPDLYDYDDKFCDYFLVEDMKRCETERPEYIGNVTPESLGLAQVVTPGTPEEESEYIKAESLRKDMGLSPVQFVDYLRDNRELCLFGNGVDDSNRRWFYSNSSREQAADMLDDMYIHRLDIEAHKKRVAEATSIPPLPVADSIASPMADIPFPTVAVDTSGLESQLAEAQKRIERLGRWNEQFMTDRAELKKALVEKDARMAELEKEVAELKEQLVAATASKGKRDNSAAIIGGLKNDVKSWKTALPIAVSATGKLLAAEATRKTRSELLLFVCETCVSKCDAPKTPCAVFSKEQFEAWRDALPSDHVDNADRSTYPLNTVKTLAGEK